MFWEPPGSLSIGLVRARVSFLVKARHVSGLQPSLSLANPVTRPFRPGWYVSRRWRSGGPMPLPLALGRGSPRSGRVKRGALAVRVGQGMFRAFSPLAFCESPPLGLQPRQCRRVCVPFQRQRRETYQPRLKAWGKGFPRIPRAESPAQGSNGREWIRISRSGRLRGEGVSGLQPSPFV